MGRFIAWNFLSMLNKKNICNKNAKNKIKVIINYMSMKILSLLNDKMSGE